MAWACGESTVSCIYDTQDAPTYLVRVNCLCARGTSALGRISKVISSTTDGGGNAERCCLLLRKYLARSSQGHRFRLFVISYPTCNYSRTRKQLCKKLLFRQQVRPRGLLWFVMATLRRRAVLLTAVPGMCLGCTTAVPLWRQSIQTLRRLPPKRDYCFILPSDNVQHDLQHWPLTTFPKEETLGNRRKLL